MTNLISCRRSSSTSLIHLFTATDCSSSPAGVAAANNVIVAAFNKLCDLVAPSLSLPIGKKLLTMEKKGSRRWMSGGSNRLGLDILSWEFSNLEKLTSCDVVSKREHFYQ
ncbi:uncharacterized protein [Arachis hypogaea]|uniref:uncharacterized protein isoform X6 n=1 Tax=Arachis hypogaea TaxID=3818 RepID=UPI003B2282DB|nr:AB hydrolase superfamily protein yfhM [Arachis hypogaea]